MKKYLIPLITVLFMGPALVCGQSDLVQVRAPNAMIIFDTSSSMNQKIDGTDANAKWYGVDKDGNAWPTGTGPWNWYWFEGGGNSPDSKLYWAKLALKQVISGLKTDINLGFSTYAQFKTDMMRGYYVRDRRNYNPGGPTLPNNCQWNKLYWAWSYSGTHTYASTSSQPFGNFKDVWNQDQTGMVKNSTFTEKKHTFDDTSDTNRPPGTYKADLTYTITDIALNAEQNYYTYTYKSDAHDHYVENYYYVNKSTNNSDCSGVTIDCNKGGDFADTQGGGVYKTFFPGEPGYKARWKCNGPTFSKGPAGPGSLGVLKQENSWVTSAGTSCTSPTGTAQNPSQLDSLGIDYWSKWTCVNPGCDCFDVSDYVYPSYGSYGNTKKPDTWSYFYIDTSGGGIGSWKWLIDNNNPGDPSKDIQPVPYYPSRIGVTPNDTPGTGDNHYFFVNIPKLDDSTNGYAVKNAILALLDLTPVKNPETLRWWTKLPLKPNSLTSNTSGTPQNQTPIADSLSMAKRYFKDYMAQDAPSQAKCRGNYIILLTDGLESCRFNDPFKNLDADFKAAETASKNLYDIGVSTFVIGLGTGVGANTNSLNKIARAGSNNVYDAFFTNTLGDLITTLDKIFQIIGGSYARSSPVVSTTRDRVYRGYFNLPGYEGHLKALGINADGSIGAEAWDAGGVMQTKGKRTNTYTWLSANVGLNRVDFTNLNSKDKNNIKLEDYLNPLNEDINNDGKVDKKDAKAVDEFTLDANYDDGSNGPGYYKGVRSGPWLLGDIYHSTPLVVGDPNFNFPDIPAFTAKYSKFKSDWTGRENIVYVGSNDGMLHGFSVIDGSEKFGIIPNNLLGKLRELRTNTHQFFVDSSPRAYDVFIAPNWRTVLVSGERGGGNSYFALDVTDPSDSGNYPIVLWDFTDPGMGNTWSRPEIGWVKKGVQEKFVAFVGGGYSTTDDVGNTFYAIDMADGSLLKKFIVGDSKNKVPAGATAFDSDLDGRVDAVYFGDINGVLWKIQINGDLDSAQLIKLYTPATSNPVFYPPAVTKNNQGSILVYYGQGNELDIFKADNNSFFEIWDRPVSAGGPVKNWEESFEPGEKMLAAPSVANGVVYFTTWKYTGDMTDCGAGKGRLWGLTTTTSTPGSGDVGALVLDPITGADLGAKKKYFDITDYYNSRGIPSAPVVTNGIIYLSTSLPADQIRTFRIPSWAGQIRLKKWREVF